MRHIVFDKADRYPVVMLIKNTAFQQHEIEKAYVEPLEKAGLDRSSLVILSLAYNASNKAPAKLIKDYLEDLMPAMASVGAETIYCADANYFKALTKQTKAEPHLGYVLPCAVEGYEHLKVILGVNHKSLIYNDANEPKLRMSLDTLVNEINGSYQAPGEDIIHYSYYPTEPDKIQEALNALLKYPRLSADIETGSLEFDKAGIGTITFCWSQHGGIAFPVDYVPFEDGPRDGLYGELVPNPEVRAMLKHFLETYEGKLIWHNCPYDTKVLIYELWMQSLLDQKGLLRGLHILHNGRVHDSKIVAYLATNSTAGNDLGLKELAHEFAGNYGMGDEIKDIRKIPLDKLLEYNLVDGLSTNYVFDKYYPIMVEDQQETLYYSLMMPSQKVITQVELQGMPLNADRVQEARAELEAIKSQQEAGFIGQPVIQKLEDKLTYLAWRKDYEDRKAKAKNPDKIQPKDRKVFPRQVFNPNSNPQLQRLFYEVMELPVIDRTKTKQPATGGDTIKKLVNHTDKPEYVQILESLMAWSEAEKILTTFIPAFERAIDKGDDVVYLHGSFNLGGTVSGRLSSSNPNLQNIPSGSTYGKLIKSCFQAPKGFLFTGADFNSLEDYVSALTTRDPNKLKVYEDGFDGHSLRAAYYFREDLPHIDLTDPESVNTIKKDYPDLRQVSKEPTFLLTYGGSYHGLMNSLGWSEEKAKDIEKNYHDLYQVSDQWVQERLDQACNDGYVTVAFGLRLRTPLLARTYRNKSSTPYEAAAEGRTAGNALGQSYGLLTNRACIEFMEKVWASPYRYDIRPVAMIHDAIYLVIKDDIDVVEWTNNELIRSMEWQELPELAHDTVKLGAALDIFYPSWDSEITLPNYASQEEIRATCAEFLSAMAEKQEDQQAA